MMAPPRSGQTHAMSDTTPAAGDATGSAPPDDALTRFMHTTMPFMAVLGAEAIVATPEAVRVRMAWRPDLCTSAEVMHGGALMSLADGTGAWCAFLHLPPGATTTTVESKTNLLRAVTGGHVEAVARPLHAGRRFVVVDTELRDEDGRLVARTTQTQAVLGGG